MEQAQTNSVVKIEGRGKKYSSSAKKLDASRKYSFTEAVRLIKEIGYAKFDETVEVSIRLGVDPKHPEQMVRGSVLLPAGLGKKVRIVVVAKGEKEKEAIKAGADFAGFEEVIQKIQGGWMEFDKLIATPDVMSQLSKLGKLLGPRGLMPNPKVGTVTFEIEKAVAEAKKGRVEFKMDKAGNLHIPVGKRSFSEDALRANIAAVMEAVISSKPPTSKGIYLRSVTLSTTMSPGIKIDPLTVKELIQK